jgi:hypothetical protein
MLRLKAGTLLDAIKLRLKVWLGTAGKVLGCVVFYYIAKFGDPSLPDKELFWFVVLLFVLGLAYEIEMLKEKLSERGVLAQIIGRDAIGLSRPRSRPTRKHSPNARQAPAPAPTR